MSSNNENLGKSLQEIFNNKYIIPLYQRNFAWRKEEIEQLLQDIFEAFNQKNKFNYYIGSLVTLKRHNGELEVIDGQQRLTTLSLISKLLGVLDHPVLSYDSRPNVDEFFSAFYHNESEIEKLSSPDVFYLKEAITHIRTANLNCKGKTLYELGDDFKSYFLNNVFLVCVEIPEDTDVAAYFEIMNNRGEQLQKHEIVKAQLLSSIKNVATQKQFAELWDACSQINIPIQRVFTAERRKQYFGDSYNDYYLIRWDEASSENTKEPANYSLANILSGKHDEILISSNQAPQSVDDESEVYQYRSIIDWSNFLMHVLKLYAPEKEIRLNEKYLLDDFKKVFDERKKEQDVLKFAKLLLFCRTVFDRFVVKVTTDTNAEDDFTWQLIKPQKYKTSWKYINSFEDKQAELVKALSMLQVTFRTRIYKNYLQSILKWFCDECFDKKSLNNIKAEDYLEFLHKFMSSYYDDNIKDKREYLTAGLSTPHFLFNFIDYLYWLKKTDFGIQEFEFKYRNSIEHHYPQQIAREKGVEPNIVDNLGNLCLISKSTNSRLSDRSPEEKANRYSSSNMGPKRQIMYKITQINGWGEKKIKAHQDSLSKLLENRNEILGIKTVEQR